MVWMAPLLPTRIDRTIRARRALGAKRFSMRLALSSRLRSAGEFSPMTVASVYHAQAHTRMDAAVDCPRGSTCGG